MAAERGFGGWEFLCLAVGPDADTEDIEADRAPARLAPKPAQSWAAFGSKTGVRADTSPYAPTRWSTSNVRSDKNGLDWSVCVSPLEVPLV